MKALSKIRQKQKLQQAGKPQTIQATPKGKEWKAIESYFSQASENTSISQGICAVFEAFEKCVDNGSILSIQISPKMADLQTLKRIESDLQQLKQLHKEFLRPFTLSYLGPDAYKRLVREEDIIRERIIKNIAKIDRLRDQILRDAVSVAKLPDSKPHQLRTGLQELKRIADSSNNVKSKSNLQAVVTYLEHMALGTDEA